MVNLSKDVLTMNDSGLYQLLLYLPSSKSIQIGKLGSFEFSQGYYIYNGSAKKGLQARVSRHLSNKKKIHWHLDYLLKHAFILETKLFYEPKLTECELNSLSFIENVNAVFFVKGFGSSDCSCISHLFYLKEYSQARKCLTDWEKII